MSQMISATTHVAPEDNNLHIHSLCPFVGIDTLSQPCSSSEGMERDLTKVRHLRGFKESCYHLEDASLQAKLANLFLKVEVPGIVKQKALQCDRRGSIGRGQMLPAPLYRSGIKCRPSIEKSTWTHERRSLQPRLIRQRQGSSDRTP